MTTIKNPQTISRNKSNNKGYVTILLLITWVVIALGYYGIKTGMLQPDSANPAIDAKIAEIQSKTTTLEGRVSTLEKRLNDVGAALTPAAPVALDAPEAAKPVDTMKAGEAPAAPVAPTETKKPETGAAMPTPDALVPAPKAEEKKKDEPAATKPQTNNHSNDKDNRAAVEKKSSNLIASYQ